MKRLRRNPMPRRRATGLRSRRSRTRMRNPRTRR